MRQFLLALLALPLAAGAQAPATGSTAPAAPAAAAPAARGPRDKAEVEAFIDGLMAAYLRDKHIAGVTVSVVRDGAVLLAKGYGYADVARRTPVDPERTLFRIGSISKLFTWTAVMQLEEQGKLDLDKDISAYLDFPIPATYPEPITLRHVLSHTPGLEEDPRDLFTSDSTHITPMSQWLPAHLPGRVRPPGTFSSYSNWATAAAGYIVERVGGEKSWDDYIERHILQPLGMLHTSGRQPLPAAMRPDMSVGYSYKNGDYAPQPFEIVTGAAPAGSISASATDMARFMMAHLNGGALGDARILSEAQAARMHARLQGHDPRIPGFAHGFYEQSSHGQRLIGHGGDTQYFHSDLALIPGEKVGVFISTNTDQGSAISFAPFLTAFLDHYYPEALPVLTPTAAAATTSKRYEGTYLFNRTNYTTYLKALGLASGIAVRANPDGSLAMQTPFGALRLVSVDSLLFRDANSDVLVAFREDEQHRITHGFLSLAPMMAMEKASTLGNPRLHQLVLGGGLATFLAILLTALVRFFLRGTPSRPVVAPLVAAGRRSLVLAGLLVLAFVVLVGVSASGMSILDDTPRMLLVALAFPVAALLATLWAAWVAVAQWRAGAGSAWTRLRHTGAVVIGLAFFWSLNAWNLLGWRM